MATTARTPGVRRTASSTLAVPITLVAKVSSGCSYDRGTSACAARCSTTSGRAWAMAWLSASRSRMSPKRDCMPWATEPTSNKLTGVPGGRAKPQTSAPMACSHRLSQLPLKPVWPVKKTRLPRQKVGLVISVPFLPGGLAAGPQVFKRHLVMQSVHGLPETVVLVGHELAVSGELHQGLLLPDGAVVFEVTQYLGREHKKTGIDEGTVALWHFFEAHDLAVLNIQRTKTTGWIGCSQCGGFTMAAMEGDGGTDIDIAHAVAIGEAKGFFVFDVFGHAAQTATGHGVVARVNQRHGPRFGPFMVHLHLVG